MSPFLHDFKEFQPQNFSKPDANLATKCHVLGVFVKNTPLAKDFARKIYPWLRNQGSKSDPWERPNPPCDTTQKRGYWNQAPDQLVPPDIGLSQLLLNPSYDLYFPPTEPGFMGHLIKPQDTASVVVVFVCLFVCLFCFVFNCLIFWIYAPFVKARNYGLYYPWHACGPYQPKRNPIWFELNANAGW